MVDDQPGKLLSYEVILQYLGENKELPGDAGLADRFISKIEDPQALFRGIALVLDRYQRLAADRAITDAALLIPLS